MTCIVGHIFSLIIPILYHPLPINTPQSPRISLLSALLIGLKTPFMPQMPSKIIKWLKHFFQIESHQEHYPQCLLVPKGGGSLHQVDPRLPRCLFLVIYRNARIIPFHYLASYQRIAKCIPHSIETMTCAPNFQGSIH